MRGHFVNWIVFNEGEKKYLLGEPRVRVDDPTSRPRGAKLLLRAGQPDEDGKEILLKRFICSLSWSLVELWEVEEPE